MFCVPGTVFGGTEGVGRRYHVLRARTCFRLYRRCRLLFSCFALPNYLSTEPRASCPVFMFCSPRLIFGGTVASGPVFMFCDPGLVFSGVRASGTVFMFCAPGLAFGGTEDVGSRFYVLRSRTRFRRYRGRRVPFSCFAPPDSLSAVLRASAPILMFAAPRIFFNGTEGVVSSFSCFALPDSFFGGIEGVGSRFYVLRAETRCRRYRGRRVPFSCVARPDPFSALPRASGPVFLFSAPDLFFDDTEGVGSRYHILRYRTHFRRYRRVPFS
jgi:hypothetical protein